MTSQLERIYNDIQTKKKESIESKRIEIEKKNNQLLRERQEYINRLNHIELYNYKLGNVGGRRLNNSYSSFIDEYVDDYFL